MAGSGSAAKKNESFFLSERFMAVTCIIVLVTGLVSLYLSLRKGEAFEVFEWVTKLATAAAMYFAFRFFKWDVAKGLMGGVLFCLMYQEAYLVIARLWSEKDFDAYLVVGVQGSIYLAAAGMAFLMTVIITVNHFFINYSSHRCKRRNALSFSPGITFPIIRPYYSAIMTNVQTKK